MKLELRPFQDDAVRELLEFLRRSREAYRAAEVHSAVGLTATTGAGKTVIATALIEAILHGSDQFGVEPDAGAVFLWLTDMPKLNEQTQNRMMDSSGQFALNQLKIVPTSFNEPVLSPGRVYFLNTQKLSKNTDLVKSGPLVGRNFTFWDVITTTIADPERTLYLVVDEAHRGMTERAEILEANSIVQRFIKGYPEAGMPEVPIVLGISATPARFDEVVEGTGRAIFKHPVPPEEVRASGLIKDKVLAEYAGGPDSDAMALLPEAVDAWWNATRAWQAYHDQYGDELVVPALIVQVENEGGGRITQTDLDAVIRVVNERAEPLPEEAFVHAFGSQAPEPVAGRVIRYLDPPQIAGDNAARVVFFKTSLGTGWDCPRAEVLFSFRRAEDATSIAQTIGRMVRTPLTRRIAENEELNAAHVFLPHYNAAAVESIVAYLEQTGNEAIAGTMTKRRETVTLPLRSDMAGVVAALNTVPSAIVPTSVNRSNVRVLADVAGFLSKTGIDPGAFAREMREAAGVLIAARDALAGDEKFVADVSDTSSVTFYQTELFTGEEPGTATEHTLPASEETIARVFAIAERKVTGEVAKSYVRQRLAADATAISLARREAYALASRSAVLDALNAHASDRIDALRQAHGAAAIAQPPAQEARWRHILRQAPSPSPAVVTLPSHAAFARGDDPLARHVFADEDGTAPLHFRSSWETAVITEELGRSGSVGWLRNVDRAEWSLTVARRDGNRWRPFYPDFLFVRQTDAGLVVDLIDPHDHTKPDAISKAKGLSTYAADHADTIVHHVDIVAKINNTYRRLHLERSAIRAQVDALGDSRAELESLYTREG